MLNAFVHGIEGTFTQDTFDFVCVMQNILSLSAGYEDVSLFCTSFEAGSDSLYTLKCDF